MVQLTQRYVAFCVFRNIKTQRVAMNGAVKQSRARHSFAPLKNSRTELASTEKMLLEGIVFDMDGTLCMSSHAFFEVYNWTLSYQANHDTKKANRKITCLLR